MTTADLPDHALQSSIKRWGEFDSVEEATSVLDLKEVLANEFVEDLIEKSCSVEYTKGDPLDGYGDDDLDPDSYSLDCEVSYSLELRKHASALRSLIALAKGRTSTPVLQPQQRLPEVPTAPKRPSTHLKHPLVHPLGFLPPRHTPFTLGQGSPPEELCVESCHKILTKSVSALAAHSGWDASMSETLFVFRDAVDDFLRRLTRMLRIAVDQEALQRTNNFPDPVEQVFQTMGLGSIRDLHAYYQVQILGRIQRLEEVCSQLTSEYVELADNYNMSLPCSSRWDMRIKQEVTEIGDEGDEDVPQLHFPSTSDGDLSLQPSATLRTGFEMLHSLEQQQLLSEEDHVGNDEVDEDAKVEMVVETMSGSLCNPMKRARRT